MIDIDEYLIAAEARLIELLHEWTPRLMKSHGIAQFDLKADKSVVTELDGLLELAIKDVLRPLSSDVGFKGEEHGEEGPDDTFWFVDPIDGTEQFIRGMDSCRTLLCLISNNEPVYAFAYRFTTGDLFTAQKDKGTRKNGELVVLHSKELSRSWVEVAADLQNPGITDKVVKLNGAVNATVYTKEFLNVLEGYIESYVVLGGKGKPWDYAPRALLMREAGLKISNIGSDTYDYTNLSLLAAHPAVFDQLHNILSPQAS